MKKAPATCNQARRPPFGGGEGVDDFIDCSSDSLTPLFNERSDSLFRRASASSRVKAIILYFRAKKANMQT